MNHLAIVYVSHTASDAMLTRYSCSCGWSGLTSWRAARVIAPGTSLARYIWLRHVRRVEDGE